MALIFVVVVSGRACEASGGRALGLSEQVAQMWGKRKERGVGPVRYEENGVRAFITQVRNG